MALQKTIRHTTGLDMTYWRIVKVDTDYNVQSGTILIYGYLDQASRDAGNGHLGYKTIRFSNAENVEVPELDKVFDNYFAITKISGIDKNSIKNAYDYIKTIPDGDFLDAIDV
jgi:hypothetical protein